LTVLRATLLVALAALAPAALADGVNRPRSANLDSDSYVERVIPQEVCESTDGALRLPQPRCADDQLSRRRIVIEDICAADVYRRTISTVQDFVDRLRIVEADGRTARPEIFFDIRSGATGRGGESRVVRYDDPRPGATCPHPRVLFRYPTRATLGRLPRGATARSGYATFVRDYSRRFRGKEVRLDELYVDRNDAFCCPSFRRVTYLRYARKRDRYVRFRTRVSRLHR
jgi:hypothetical protein